MSESIYKNFHPLFERDCVVYARGKSVAVPDSVPAISADQTGASPDVPCVIGISHVFGEAAQPGNIRSLDVAQLFNFAGDVAIVSGQSLVAVRGVVTVAAATELTSAGNGYSYAVQGKHVIQGEIDVNSGFVAALFGQCDTSGASCVLTSGYVSALHLDMGATSILASSAFLNAESITNTTQCLINSVLKVIANASYFMDLAESNLTGNWIVSSSGMTSQAKSLKVLIGGVPHYIPLCTGTT